MNMLPLALFVSVPVVVITAAFVYFIGRGEHEQEPARETESDSSGSKPVWIVTALLSLVFIGVGFPKLGEANMVLTSFDEWGYPDAMHSIIGAIEFIAAILLLIPSTATMAALVLTGVMVGAGATHAVHGPFWMMGVNAVLFAGLVWVGLKRLPEFESLFDNGSPDSNTREAKVD